MIIAVGIGVYYTMSNNDVKNDGSVVEVLPGTEKWVNNEEIQIFRKYLSFPTVTLDSDFGKQTTGNIKRTKVGK